jgi:hypothetical protein
VNSGSALMAQPPGSPGQNGAGLRRHSRHRPSLSCSSTHLQRILKWSCDLLPAAVNCAALTLLVDCHQLDPPVVVRRHLGDQERRFFRHIDAYRVPIGGIGFGLFSIGSNTPKGLDGGYASSQTQSRGGLLLQIQQPSE